MIDVAHQPTPRDLLAAFHRAMVALSADDLADLHAPDAVYELPLLTPGRPERYDGREEIRVARGRGAGRGMRRSARPHERARPGA